jgi:site-specific recombinase XerD
LSNQLSLFDALCEANAVQGNPVDGVKRPKVSSQEGSTPAIGDHQARALLAAPDDSTLKGLRDRAMLATLLYHGVPTRHATAYTTGRKVPIAAIRNFLNVCGSAGSPRLPYSPSRLSTIKAFGRSVRERLQGQSIDTRVSERWQLKYGY